jgi:hypothetical protein
MRSGSQVALTGFLVLNNPVNSELLTINPSALLQEGTAINSVSSRGSLALPP